MSMTINGTSGLTFNDGSTQPTAANGNLGFRNRIINGAMMIDQRNAGASVTPNNSYTLDRWVINNSQTSKLTVQQSSTAPTGFSNSLLVTSSSAYSITSTDYFVLQQRVEGFNFADAMYGTANAQTFTISFWVRSSLTGTFGGSFENSAFNYSYPFSYTISSANTWEQKSITISGATSGTWIGATNGVGLVVNFGLGVGSTYSGTSGSWAATNYNSATGATSVVGTNGATFYITGVQLEKGSTATLFDNRPYGTELALCQRYYEKSYNIGTVPATATGTGQVVHSGSTDGSAHIYVPVRYKVQKRTDPTVNFWDGSGNANQWTYVRSGASGSVGVSANGNGENGFNAVDTAGIGSTFVSALIYGHWVSSAEL